MIAQLTDQVRYYVAHNEFKHILKDYIIVSIE